MMLCKSGKEADIKDFESKKWLASNKIDGVRCKAFVGLDVTLTGRAKGSNYNKQFPEIVEALKELPLGYILDGEIFCGDFNVTAGRVHLENQLKIDLITKNAVFYVFDIINLNGTDLSKKPLKERLKLLAENIPDSEHIKKIEHSDKIREKWLNAIKNKAEGIVIKNPNSIYENDKRSENWVKIKYKKSKDLKFNSYENNNAGIRIETQDKTAIQINGRMAKIVKDKIDKNGFCYVEVEYLNETENGKLRQPVFKDVKIEQNIE